ncbi:flavin reductase [Ottowia thiooxydans]|uniref:flavin reductase n=1 Tax=Ottowia thiooxydans TaxID=219182 RepID=UPI0003F80ABC|nr:flavin reductase [Ottowia thiooxydans]
MSQTALPTEAIDQKRFRQLLGCFPTGVAIISTSDHDGRPLGLTCNSFSSVSLEPPLVLFSLRNASSLLARFMEADAFAINILSQSQDQLSGRFASSKIADKFEGVSWRAGPLGTPLIDGCLASFECQVHARHEAGDHTIFIGEVKHMGADSADHALVFYKGAYMMLAESLRKLVLEGKLNTADIDEAYRALYGTLLRLGCERATPEEVDAIEAAVHEIEQHQHLDALPKRIDATARFFSSIAQAGHNEALTLMAQTMTAVLRERMTHVLPTPPRPDVFPLRRKIVDCLRARDVDGATAALDALITCLRKEAGTS